MNWCDYGFYITPDTPPHLTPVIGNIPWGGYRHLIAKWTEDFDCLEETQFWWVIMDKPFDVSALKAKRRYEITKGNRNFYTKVIHPKDYADALYDVYLESLQGYKNPSVQPQKSFEKQIDTWEKNETCVFFGVFEQESNRLCGFADVYDWGRYLPISSLKTRVGSEKNNVNFALVYGITQHFDDRIRNGAYLCDGSRNALHETHFQDFLMKYFGFRKAYCHLKLRYRGAMNLVIAVMFPVRKQIGKVSKLRKLSALLKMYAWSKNMDI